MLGRPVSIINNISVHYLRKIEETEMKALMSFKLPSCSITLNRQTDNVCVILVCCNVLQQYYQLEDAIVNTSSYIQWG